MKKRMLSLLCVLALCLGLLPATALAVGEDAPAKLYVRNQAVIVANTVTYWTTDNSGGLTRVDGATDDSDNWTVRYNPNTATLTLRGATIQGQDFTESAPFGAGIYAVCSSNQPVALTIELIGTNIITGNYGIYVDAQQGGTVGTNASLLIQNSGDDGSLEVSGSSYGIYVKSGTGDASLTIKNASVDAKTTQTYSSYAGVCVQSGSDATSSPQLSLAVNGGSLTTSASEGNDGIQFYVGSSEATGAITSLTVNNNAIVKAINGIEGYRVDKPIPSGTGIVFDDKEGTVYGDVELQEDLEIGEGESLTIPSGSSLNANGKLTNDGTINVESGGNLEGEPTSGSGTVVKAPTITTPPTNQSVTVGQNASFTVEANGDSLSYQWQQSADNGTNWNNISGATSNSYTTDAATLEMNNYQYQCVVSNSAGSVTSSAATLTVNAATVPVTGVSLTPASLSLFTGDTATLTATVQPSNATNKKVTWSSNAPGVATVDSSGKVTAVAPGTATITVTTEDGNYTATCTVTVSRYSSGGSSSSSTSLSDQAIDDIQDARPGDTVEITLRPGRTTLEREVFEELAGQDITLEIDAGDGVLWTVNGLDIPEDTRLHDLDLDVDLDVDLGDSGIPATVLNAVTGEVGTVQLSLAHDGQFGFTMTLSAPLGRDNADYWANLYWYNERTEELEFQQAARIAEDGTAEFDLDHASDYAIVIDDRSHEPVDLPFNDVPEGYWAYGAIQYVYGEGLMAGTSGSTFSPEGTTTRGQIVTILWRLSGSPVVNYLMDFDDVNPAAYYAEAIRWATSEGIAGGYGGGLFGPDDPITREQLAVMLHRYAQHEGCDVSIGEDINILSYADAFTVSEYAVSALQWACGAGIISGTGDGSTLTPQGEATRAQAATVLMRFCELPVQ